MGRFSLALASLALLACEASIIRMEDGGVDIFVDTGGDTADTAFDPGYDPAADTGIDTIVDTSIDTGTDTSTDPGADPPPTGLCDRWRADRADLSEGTWSGSVSGCNPGDISADGRENALRQVNLFRWMAGLPAVATDAGRNSQSQACALMMHANGDLSHYPPSTWTCYTDPGAEAAGRSNIASGPCVMAVDMYMQDWGNEETLGHRRWILSNGLGPIGIGSTSDYSCMWVLYGSGTDSTAWTAWPPPGDFPIQAVQMSWIHLDETGWTVQSDSIDLNPATVTITDAGTPRPVSVVVLSSGYGSTWAINMIPQGWTAQVGHTYHVELTGISTPITYDVVIVDCA